MSEETVLTSMRLPLQFRNRLKAAAEADRRSMSDFVLVVVSAYLDGRRYVPHAAPASDGDSAQLEHGALIFKRPPGRPRKPRPGAVIEGWLVTKIERLLNPLEAVTIPDAMHALELDPAVQHNDVMLANHLLHLSWVPREHPTDAREVWLSPEHPQWSPNG